MNKNMRKSVISYLVLFALIVGILSLIQSGSQNVDLSYTEKDFKEDMQEGKVTSVFVQQNAEVPTGTVEVTMNDRSSVSFFVTDVNDFQELFDELAEQGDKEVGFRMSDVVRPGLLEKLLPYILGMIAIIIVASMLMGVQSSSGGSTMVNFGRSKAQVTLEDENSITFADVAGLREEKEDLEEVVDFLKNPGKYTKLGARIPKGILLVGPPGTGKTLLAKAVAGEAHVPFFSISGSDFVEMFVGVGAARVRDLFAEAKRNSPCIVFIDEIDAVARRRGTGLGGGHDEREQTLNQMLVEMDGFTVNEGIIVLAATNRVDILDPAILRPGRFDRKVAVGRPDVKGREDILKVHTRNKPLSEEVDLGQIARTTAGFVGADLENLMNESAIYAAKQERKFIIKEDIDKAFIKVGIGTERKSRLIPEKERRNTAYHEAGHAILFHLLEGVGPVYTVSIIPTGEGAAGYTMPLPENDNVFNTKGKILQDIKVSLGGRIAEEMIFEDITTGASQDIKQATAAARAMVVKYGMSDEMGLINYETDNEQETFVGRDIGHRRMLAEQTAAAIDKEVKRIIDDCYAQARKLLEENVDILHRCADRLLEKERIDRTEFEALFNEN
ncbi:MAG: ATP-dependent zinc metalloprotease FtsH [Clostridium sp.]|nr:ATP-dependent zinc metalloprotease FtsH [Clostridium sp.]